MKKNKIIILFICIVLISFIIPRVILFVLEDNNLEYIHIEKRNMFKKDNNIYINNPLINIIYEKYHNEGYSFEVELVEFLNINGEVINKEIENIILNDLKDLIVIKMIDENFIQELVKKEDVCIKIMKSENKEINYNKYEIYIEKNNAKIVIMEYEKEESTKKIVSLKIPNDSINFSNTVIADYIKYLQLENNDWIYERDVTKSESLKVQIKLQNINEFTSITLIPLY